MKRQSMMLISLLGVALMTSASVFAQGGQGGMGVPGGMVDPPAVMQQDRLQTQTQTRDQLRIHQEPLLSVDQDQDQDKDQLRLQDGLQDKDQDQLRDRDRIHVPQ